MDLYSLGYGLGKSSPFEMPNPLAARSPKPLAEPGLWLAQRAVPEFLLFHGLVNLPPRNIPPSQKSRFNLVRPYKKGKQWFPKAQKVRPAISGETYVRGVGRLIGYNC